MTSPAACESPLDLPAGVRRLVRPITAVCAGIAPTILAVELTAPGEAPVRILVTDPLLDASGAIEGLDDDDLARITDSGLLDDLLDPRADLPPAAEVDELLAGLHTDSGLEIDGSDRQTMRTFLPRTADAVLGRSRPRPRRTGAPVRPL